jgi:hypothetical protein
MKMLLLVSVLTLASCATAMKKEDSVFTFVETTTVDKVPAFNSALSYLAKNLGDSNYAIKIKDETNGKIITQIGTGCNELRAFADFSNYTVNYTLEADFKDKKVRLSLEGNTYTQVGIDGKHVVVSEALREYQKDGVKACASKIKDGLLASLKTSTSSNW